jgi:hypothetical protein
MARERGNIAVKWQSFAGDLPPRHRGFTSMRAPYQSAAGTEGVRGYILWLNPVTHDEPPYYAQTSTFTCGAVTALLASEIRGSGGFKVDGNNRDRELAFWRQASNFPACEPIGLAVALRGSIDDAAGTAPVDVFLDTNGPALLETFPDGFDRKFREELQVNSLRQALNSDITVHRERLSIDELVTRIEAGDLALGLIDTQLMYGFAVPHWVLAHSVEHGLVIIDDPTISSSWGETWVDAHEIPITIQSLDHMLAWARRRLSRRGVHPARLTPFLRNRQLNLLVNRCTSFKLDSLQHCARQPRRTGKKLNSELGCLTARLRRDHDAHTPRYLGIAEALMPAPTTRTYALPGA